jgi:hypothetical protein
VSVERFVEDVRAAVAALAGSGAVSAGPATVTAWRGLAERSRALGLAHLAGDLDAVAGHLADRSTLAYHASVPLASAVLAAHDRIEALASALLLWSVSTRIEGRG